jgi:hypothetical protein
MRTSGKLALSALLALTACAGRPPLWAPAEGPFVAARAGFEVLPPQGWMRMNPGANEVFVVTRDGMALQRIVVGASELGKPIGMGGSKRPVLAGMSPQELAELVIDDIRAAEALTDVRVLESAPAALAGRRGFRVLAGFRDARGLATRAAVYGLVEGERFYRAMYIAPERHYFALDLPMFESVVSTIRLRPPEPGPSR